MQLFETLLDQAVEAKRQVHVTTRYAYLNVILTKAAGNYHALLSTPEQNAGLSFKLESVRQVSIQQGTDGKPCYDIALNAI